jgi:hypothetical protein
MPSQLCPPIRDYEFGYRGWEEAGKKRVFPGQIISIIEPCLSALWFMPVGQDMDQAFLVSLDLPS